jgi:hypothetical protein
VVEHGFVGAGLRWGGLQRRPTSLGANYLYMVWFEVPDE